MPQDRGLIPLDRGLIFQDHGILRDREPIPRVRGPMPRPTCGPIFPDRGPIFWPEPAPRSPVQDRGREWIPRSGSATQTRAAVLSTLPPPD